MASKTHPFFNKEKLKPLHLSLPISLIGLVHRSIRTEQCEKKLKSFGDFSEVFIIIKK